MIALLLFSTEPGPIATASPRRFLAWLRDSQTRRAAQVIQAHAHLLAAPDELMDFGAATPQQGDEEFAGERRVSRS